MKQEHQGGWSGASVLYIKKKMNYNFQKHSFPKTKFSNFECWVFLNCHTWINRKEKVGSNSISAWQIPKIGTISEENTPPTQNHHVQKRMCNIIFGKEFVINRRGERAVKFYIHMGQSVHCLSLSHTRTHTHTHACSALLADTAFLIFHHMQASHMLPFLTHVHKCKQPYIHTRCFSSALYP